VRQVVKNGIQPSKRLIAIPADSETVRQAVQQYGGAVPGQCILELVLRVTRGLKTLASLTASRLSKHASTRPSLQADSAAGVHRQCVSTVAQCQGSASWKLSSGSPVDSKRSRPSRPLQLSKRASTRPSLQADSAAGVHRQCVSTVAQCQGSVHLGSHLQSHPWSPNGLKPSATTQQPCSRNPNSRKTARTTHLHR
jgi:hypothetical protein